MSDNPLLQPTAPQEIVSDKIIMVDYRQFKDTIFRKCTLVYSGGFPPTLENVSFDNCAFSFDGAARNTIDYLRMLSAGNPDAQAVILRQMLGIDE